MSIKLYISKEDPELRWAKRIAKEPRAVLRGEPINAGDSYYIFYRKNINNGKLDEVGKIKDPDICEFCHSPIFKLPPKGALGLRFCSDFCSGTSFERETIDAEENMFYGRENRW